MFWQVFKLALENIRKYKVRSLLTMLGVVIGVMSVIFIAAIISGLNLTVSRQVQSLDRTLSASPGFRSLPSAFPQKKSASARNLRLKTRRRCASKPRTWKS